MGFSDAVRRKVLERASGLCERKLPTGRRCLAPGAELHHIVPRSHHGKKKKELVDSEANCMLLCLGCHRDRHDTGRWNDDADELVPGCEIRALL